MREIETRKDKKRERNKLKVKNIFILMILLPLNYSSNLLYFHL